MVVFESDDAIATQEVEVVAVELGAEFQSGGESVLDHAGIENLALEVVDGLILRTRKGQRHQASKDQVGGHQGNRAAGKAHHVNLSKNACRTLRFPGAWQHVSSLPVGPQPGHFLGADIEGHSEAAELGQPGRLSR
jgi:hypothetical protein